MKHILCSNGSGIDEKLWSVNRSWTSDSHFSLRKPIHRGKSGQNVQRECPDTATRGRRFPFL